jgi:hypothetical protein
MERHLAAVLWLLGLSGLLVVEGESVTLASQWASHRFTLLLVAGTGLVLSARTWRRYHHVVPLTSLALSIAPAIVGVFLAMQLSVSSWLWAVALLVSALLLASLARHHPGRAPWVLADLLAMAGRQFLLGSGLEVGGLLLLWALVFVTMWWAQQQRANLLEVLGVAQLIVVTIDTALEGVFYPAWFVALVASEALLGLSLHRRAFSIVVEAAIALWVEVVRAIDAFSATLGHAATLVLFVGALTAVVVLLVRSRTQSSKT